MENITKFQAVRWLSRELRELIPGDAELATRLIVTLGGRAVEPHEIIEAFLASGFRKAPPRAPVATSADVVQAWRTVIVTRAPEDIIANDRCLLVEPETYCLTSV